MTTEQLRGSVRTPVVSAAVMAHPSRLAEAETLAALLAPLRARVALDPRPDGPPTTLRAARAAWAAIGDDATHHLVLQDDVVLCRDFTARVEAAVREHPDTPLAFYANWNSWNGAATRAAALQGASWVPAVPGEWVPTLALLLPRRDVTALLDAVPGDGAEPEPDDVVLARELGARGRQVLISVPHLVEHVGRPSIVGNDGYGPRHSTCFADDVHTPEDEDLHAPGATLPATPETLVHRPHGHSRVVLTRAAAGLPPLFLSREAFLRETGFAELGRAHWEEARGGLSVPEDVLRLCEEIWYGGYLLGLLTPPATRPPSPRMLRVVLRSLVLGGSAGDPRHRLWLAQRVTRMVALAEHAFTAGTEGRAVYGAPGPLPEERLAGLPEGRHIWSRPELAEAT
ncbi:hypothetical protein CTZ27_32720 [Streptomyces griseocarneus]|nr:hypothetical protein CTZ27_32720 [Streptomyces griseocarneus]